jgi:hypothetical protein
MYHCLIQSVFIISFGTEGTCTIVVTVVYITTCTPDEHFADFEVMGLNPDL